MLVSRRKCGCRVVIATNKFIMHFFNILRIRIINILKNTMCDLLLLVWSGVTAFGWINRNINTCVLISHLCKEYCFYDFFRLMSHNQAAKIFRFLWQQRATTQLSVFIDQGKIMRKLLVSSHAHSNFSVSLWYYNNGSQASPSIHVKIEAAPRDNATAKVFKLPSVETVRVQVKLLSVWQREPWSFSIDPLSAGLM